MANNIKEIHITKDDTDYKVSVVLDSGSEHSNYCYESFVSYLANMIIEDSTF